MMFQKTNRYSSYRGQLLRFWALLVAVLSYPHLTLAATCTDDEQLFCEDAGNQVIDFNIYSEVFGPDSQCFVTDVETNLCFLAGECSEAGFGVHYRGDWLNCESDGLAIALPGGTATPIALLCPPLEVVCPDVVRSVEPSLVPSMVPSFGPTITLSLDPGSMNPTIEPSSDSTLTPLLKTSSPTMSPVDTSSSAAEKVPHDVLIGSILLGCLQCFHIF